MTLSNERPRYDTKQFDGELWGIQTTSSLPSLSGPLWPGVIASDRALSMGQIELLTVVSSLLFLHLLFCRVYCFYIYIFYIKYAFMLNWIA